MNLLKYILPKYPPAGSSGPLLLGYYLFRESALRTKLSWLKLFTKWYKPSFLCVLVRFTATSYWRKRLLVCFKLILKWKTIIFATGQINNTRKIRNDMFPLDENSQSKSISPRARTFGDPFTFSCSNYQEIHTRSQHRNPKILNNTRPLFAWVKK